MVIVVPCHGARATPSDDELNRLSKELKRAKINASDTDVSSRSLLQMGHASVLGLPRSSVIADVRDVNEGLAVMTFITRDTSEMCSSSMRIGMNNPLPTRTKCPEQCPFSHPIQEDPCHKVCVSGDGCSKFGSPNLRGFPDHRSWECTALCGSQKEEFIVGCAECASVGICKTCATGYTLSPDGKRCGHRLDGFWYWVYAVIIAIVAVLIHYLVRLSQRSNINADVLSRALLHRHRRKVWQERHSDRTWHAYELLGTRVYSTDVSGQGVWLYFRVLFFAMAVALILAIGSFVTYSLSDVKTFHEDEFSLNCDIGEEMEAAAGTSTVNDPSGMLGAYETYGTLMFSCLVIMYIVVFILSMVFLRHQVDASNRWDEQNATHEDYAVIVRGLPLDATDPVVLKDFFQEALEEELAQISSDNTPAVSRLGTAQRASIAIDHKIIGVSIAYDYKEHQALIEDALQDWIEELEEDILNMKKSRKPARSQVAYKTEKAQVPPGLAHAHTTTATTISTARSQSDPQAASAQEVDTDRKGFFASLPNLSFLDYLFGGGVDESKGDDRKQKREEVKRVLSDLPGSGYAYIIGSTPVVGETLLARFARKDAPTFRSSRLVVHEVYSEPPSIYWGNFTQKVHFWFRIMLGVLITMATMAGWITLYMPYALSYITSVQIPGERPSVFQDTLLGLLISAGNAVVALVVDIVTRMAGFHQKDRRDMAVLAMAFLATLLNTLCDIWIAAQIAQGTLITDSLEGQINSFDRAISRELMGVIVPGYILLPYLIAPFFEHVVPYFLGKWFVRSKRMSLRESEDRLACPEFDICWRYSDTLNNFTICLSMLMFATPYSYMVMCWLIAYLVLIYGIDKYKLLRYTSQTFYTTNRLNNAAMAWFVVPTGVLAGITMVWGCRCKFFNSNLHHELVVIGVVSHVVLYALMSYIVRSWVSPANTETTPYGEMCNTLWDQGKVWSYFNTNPIFCLRSKYFGIKEPGARNHPSIPYVPGKQWLQPDAPMRFALHELDEQEELSELGTIARESSKKLLESLSNTLSFSKSTASPQGSPRVIDKPG